jgi:hypothetical protein
VKRLPGRRDLLVLAAGLAVSTAGDSAALVVLLLRLRPAGSGWVAALLAGDAAIATGVSLGWIFGPAAGGLLAGTFGATTALLVDALTFAVLAAAASPLVALLGANIAMIAAGRLTMSAAVGGLFRPLPVGTAERVHHTTRHARRPPELVSRRRIIGNKSVRRGEMTPTWSIAFVRELVGGSGPRWRLISGWRLCTSRPQS